MSNAGDKIRSDTTITDAKFKAALASALDELGGKLPETTERLVRAMEYDRKVGRTANTATKLAEAVTFSPEMEAKVFAIIGDDDKAKALQARLHQINSDNKRQMDAEANKGLWEFLTGDFAKPAAAGMAASATQKAVLDDIAKALQTKMDKALIASPAPETSLTKPLPTPPKLPATTLQDERRGK